MAAIAQARHMRQAPVATERLLWTLLRDRQLDGLKFRRQVLLGRYIADFVCFRHRLVVEADGLHHEGRDRDLVRDAWLREQGFRVMRFSNRVVHDDREAVLAAILAACGR